MLKSLLLIMVAVFIGVSGQLSLKYGVNQIGRIDNAALSNIGQLVTKVALNPFVVLGIAFYGLGAIVWIVVLSRVPLSFAYPMLGLSYVLVLLFSWLILHEHVSAVRWAGAVLIILGVVMVSQSADKEQRAAAPTVAMGNPAQ